MKRFIMTAKRIVKNYIYNTAYQLLLVLTPLLTAPYISRVLGVTGVSIFNYAYADLTYFILFGTLGSALFAQREIAYNQDDREKRSRIFKEILIFRMVLVAVSIVIFIFAVALRSEYRTVYLIMTVELVATAIDVSWFFQGMEDFKKTVVRNVIVKIIGTVLIFVFVKGPGDLIPFVLCMTVPVFIGNLSLWAYLPKYISRKAPISIKSILKYFKPMLALFIPQVAVEVYTVLDKTMIGNLASSMDFVGYYTNAQHIVKTLLQLITSLGIVMLPAVSSAFAKKNFGEIEKMTGKSFNFTAILGFPMMFGIAAVANNFAVWFYGDGYEPVGPLMMAMSPIIILIGCSIITGRQYLLPIKRQKAYTGSVIAGAVVNVIMNFIFIPLFDAVGACIGTVFAELTVAVIQLFFIRKELPLGTYFKENFKYFIYSAVMFAAVFPIEFAVSGILGTLIQVVAGIAVYFGLLLITRDKNLFYYAGLLIGKLKKNDR